MPSIVVRALPGFGDTKCPRQRPDRLDKGQTDPLGKGLGRPEEPGGLPPTSGNRQDGRYPGQGIRTASCFVMTPGVFKACLIPREGNREVTDQMRYGSPRHERPAGKGLCCSRETGFVALIRHKACKVVLCRRDVTPILRDDAW